MKKFLLIGGVLVVLLGALLPKPTKTSSSQPKPDVSFVATTKQNSTSPVAKPEKTYRFHLKGVKAVSE
ncbi:MAG: hypothetical protein COV91_05910 [Candidatus Taylorbacteria bacterium CG11_big_fil_rev_8_21_14_0_20_46_11]|uniref:Uncharacterized protein n=1 Tax=Candidatus Taylorbacteria bacterium CG11_big_fil_rev_8_21_14_0_20_46_11 TaxID=1975025 RepID=A0A2H0KA16_9BACT|nr:MAG: hypothetical protein COV91_05910 [Candidatus Taylorbacteria bacterium CG11_big_fil_rev_8_21_14_0_20_46_11]